MENPLPVCAGRRFEGDGARKQHQDQRATIALAGQRQVEKPSLKSASSVLYSEQVLEQTDENFPNNLLKKYAFQIIITNY